MNNNLETLADQLGLKTQSQLFSVSFKLHYKTVPGEDLFVVGEIPELGTVGEHKHPLKWTQGHIWVSEIPLLTSQSIFHYKYVLLGVKKEVLNSEQGIHRIADLSLLPDCSCRHE